MTPEEIPVTTGARLASWWRRSPRVQEIPWLIATMVLSIVAATWVLGLQNAPWRVPLDPQGDTYLGLSAIKGMLENGWFLVNPALGAPDGQNLVDFSGFNGDHLYWFVLRFLGLFISDPVLLLNTFFVLGFAMISGVAYVVLRDLGVRRMTSLALSAFYANLAFHFHHGEGHLVLSNYFAVPAGIWLVLRVAMGKGLIRKGTGGRLRQWFTGTNVATVLAVIAVGGSTLYYAVFTLILLVFATAFRALAQKNWRGLLAGGGAFVGVAVVLFLNILPAIIYLIANGPNTGLAARVPYESSLYSFDLTRLVFLVSGHRIGWLSDLGNQVAQGSLTLGEGDQLGIVLGFTFLAMLGMLGVWLARGRGAQGARGPLLNATVLMALIVFLLGTVGGLGAMIANLISPQIRSWSRLTPFLAFLCVIVLCLGIDWLRERIGAVGPRRVLSAALPLVVAAGALWDGTSPTNRPNYAGNAARWAVDGQFAAAIAARMPEDSAILQMPVRTFPEAGGINGMGDYEHLVGYIHSDGLRWSYGGVKGRPSDWSAAAADLPPEELIPAAVAAGFTGLWIDRRAYQDDGAALERTVQSVTGLAAPTAKSRDGIRVFYDLRPYRARLDRATTPAGRTALANALLHPTMPVYGAGFYLEEKTKDETWRWASRDAVLTITNGASAPQDVVWRARFRSAPGSRLTISYGGKVVARRSLTGDAESSQVRLRLQVPPGGGELRFTTDGKDLGPENNDARSLYLQVVDPTLVNTALAAER